MPCGPYQSGGDQFNSMRRSLFCIRRKGRMPPWTTLHLTQPARSPLMSRGKLFKRAEPLLSAGVADPVARIASLDQADKFNHALRYFLLEAQFMESENIRCTSLPRLAVSETQPSL